MKYTLYFQDSLFYKYIFKVKDIEKVKVVAGKTLIICKELKRGEKLHWWISADSDFGMGVFFSENKEEKNVER